MGVYKYNLESVRKLFAKEGYTLYGAFYKNCHTKMELACPNGSKWFSSVINYNSGYRCPCFKCKGRKLKWTKEEAEKIVTTVGCSILGEFKSRQSRLVLWCAKGKHQWATSLHSILHGSRCPNCGDSRGEIEILEFVKSEGFKAAKDKEIIKPFEIDVYVPELKLGIEHSGLFWHSTRKKPANHLRKKHNLCADKGITLITVLEDEWIEKRERVKEAIKVYLHAKTLPKYLMTTIIGSNAIIEDLRWPLPFAPKGYQLAAEVSPQEFYTISNNRSSLPFKKNNLIYDCGRRIWLRIHKEG